MYLPILPLLILVFISCLTTAQDNTASTTAHPQQSPFASSLHKPLSRTTSRLQATASALSHSRSFSASPSFTFQPHHAHSQNPARSSPGPQLAPDGNGGTQNSGSRHQSTVAIVFEILGGLAGLVSIFFCGRCCYTYHRMPRADRIAAVVDRHLLERELAEMEEAQQERRVPYMRPPPPYQCAPHYDEVVRHTPDHPP